MMAHLQSNTWKVHTHKALISHVLCRIVFFEWLTCDISVYIRLFYMYFRECVDSKQLKTPTQNFSSDTIDENTINLFVTHERNTQSHVSVCVIIVMNVKYRVCVCKCSRFVLLTRQSGLQLRTDDTEELRDSACADRTMQRMRRPVTLWRQTTAKSHSLVLIIHLFLWQLQTFRYNYVSLYFWG